MRYRGLIPPTVLILDITGGGGLGCESQAAKDGRLAKERQAREEAARQNKEWEDGQRHEAETAPPTPEVMTQVKDATFAFMENHHPELVVENVGFTPLTPNLYLLAVSVHDPIKGNSYVAQLSAERLRDVAWGEGGAAQETGGLLWVVDYADEARMKSLAELHGFQGEVDRIRDHDSDGRYRNSWGRRSWVDDYLLWHFLFHRPYSYGYASGRGFAPMAPGFRPQEPARPLTPMDAQRFAPAAAPTGGRSMVFLGGSAWRPPLVSAPTKLSGDAFAPTPGGGVHGVGPVSAARSGAAHAGGSVSRGGFGGSGHAAGTGAAGG